VSTSLGLGLRDWHAAEILAGLRGACGLVSRVAVERDVSQWFSRAYGRPALVLNSGTSALQLALECLKAERPGRSEVVLPALGCPALTRAVVACGLQPVYADIGADLNTPAASVAACLAPGTLAVVMVHAYGLAADCAGLTELCRDAGVALIDDAAQRVDPAAGLGTGGDFGIFSFAQSKSVVSGIHGSGGVLLLNEPRYRPAIVARHQRLSAARGRRLAWLEFLASPHAPKLAYYLARWRRALTTATDAPAHIGALDAAIAIQQLETLDERRAKRLSQLQWYGQALEAAGLEAPQLPGGRVAGYLARLLVRLPVDQRAVCRDAMHAQGIATRLPYILPGAVSARSHPSAHRAAAELLELPMPPQLTASDAQRVVATLAACRHTPSNNITRRVPACSITGN
jgi:perosamine synthetase